ncbi:MAG: DUF799 family lipoprotein [Acidobacteriota bacterium]
MSRDRIVRVATLLAVLGVAGCASVPKARFVHPEFDFGYVERVAVLPFGNLSPVRDAGEKAGRLFITELLATGAVDVVEPGEVRAAVEAVLGGGTDPTTEQIQALGRRLGVQALVLGTVTEFETVRSGASSVPVITIDAHMVETESGATVWAATHTVRGTTFSSRVFGSGALAGAEAMRRCVHELVEALTS